MRNPTLILAVLVWLAGLSACSTTAQKDAVSRPGLPEWTWDAEYDEFIAHYGPVGHSFFVVANLVNATLEMDQGTTYLSPSELHEIITSSLDAQSRLYRAQYPLPAAAIQGPTPNQSDPDAPNFFWSIAESTEAEIVTNWNPVPGRLAGLFWWKKRYQAQVRHIIEIQRSLSSPQRASFSITTEVRERPNSSYPWILGDPEYGRASFEELQSTLRKPIRKALASRIIEETKR